jgi:mono/diheme cytochrome c family protein
MKKTFAMLIVGGFLASLAVTVTAQATRSVNEGVYTADQAKKGEALYKEQCAACHGDNLEGSGPMPPLAGKDFLANWTGKTVGDLYEKTQTTMPATAPGTLTPEQAADVVAFLLSKDNYPTGSAALEGKTEPLLQIKIEEPKQ